MKIKLYLISLVVMLFSQTVYSQVSVNLRIGPPVYYTPPVVVYSQPVVYQPVVVYPQPVVVQPVVQPVYVTPTICPVPVIVHPRPVVRIAPIVSVRFGFGHHHRH